MYPDRELIRLAAHKAALRRSIAGHRAQCVSAAVRLAQPFAWLDRALAFWRKLSPLTTLAALPLGWLAQRTVFRRLKFIGPLFRWGPIALSAASGMFSA